VDRATRPATLGATTWTDLADRPGPTFVVMPVGSCEQHGPHLPLHTDTLIATALADELAARRDDCLVAPALAVTASGEHAGFPGTLSIGTDVLADVVVEVARSADWCDGVVFVNGHGGNVTAMRRAEEVFARERRRVLVWWPTVPGGDLHAGRTETSLMLALAPGSVRVADAVAGPVPPLTELVDHGVRSLSPSGVLGDPGAATSDEGQRLFHDLADALARAVDDWVGRLGTPSPRHR
jgi:creatinine amidohydrolase